jgi:hypothetical protein
MAIEKPITKVIPRTARKGHACEGCHLAGRTGNVIAPGHRYLVHRVYADGYAVAVGTHPYELKECASCAVHRDHGADVGPLAACGTYCHGLDPCALPFGHGGDRHACRQDAEDAAREKESAHA